MVVVAAPKVFLSPLPFLPALLSPFLPPPLPPFKSINGPITSHDMTSHSISRLTKRKPQQPPLANQSTNQMAEEDPLHSLIMESVPEAMVVSSVGKERNYRLPFASASKFVAMFRQMDQRVRCHRCHAMRCDDTMRCDVMRCDEMR